MASRPGALIIMTRFRIDLRGGAFRSVLGFTWTHWQRQPVRFALTMAAFLIATLADVLTPLYAGRLVDAVAGGSASDTAAWNAAIAAFTALMGLAMGALLLRHLGFMAIIDLTLKMMGDIGADAFRACSASRPTGMPTASPDRPCERSRAACGRSTF
jgi:ATP-binding cassette subfamily B protein